MSLDEIKTDLSFIWQFSVDDFKGKYAGSFVGSAWAFLQPLMTIIIYWFVFQIGFGNDSVKGYPFILWLISGLVPWFFINEGLISVTTSLAEYGYLVKKIVFNISILPLVKILSCFFVQIFLVLITIFFFCLWGYFPDLYYLQLIKDLIQIINIFMQIIFWVTPIVWNFDIMPLAVQKVLVFNPVYYIIKGYRDIFIDKVFFFENIESALYYWIIAIFLFIIGRTIFKKLKIHFADVLWGVIWMIQLSG